jgi:hypothetical protein
MNYYDRLWPNPTQLPPSARSPRGTAYAGINTTRQGKFEARSDRRWGDWSILGLAIPLLWFDAAYLAAADDVLGCPDPEIIDLWP